MKLEQPTESMQWYIVQTYSGYENKAKIALEERIRSAGAEEDFEEIFIPMENITEVRSGQRRETRRKVFNGYIFVRMNLNDNSWHIVKSTPKIVGFLGGNQRMPPPVPQSRIDEIRSSIEEGARMSTPTYSFEQGDQVRVTDGNFKDFTGTVEEVNEEKQKLRVFVEIFGRPTSVEFEFNQVEAIIEQ